MLNKLAFVGAGDVGSQTAFLCAQKSLAKEIALVDIAGNLARGRALDISHSLGAKGNELKITAGEDYAQLAGADVIVVTAGKALVAPTEGEYSRDKLLETNMAIIDSVFVQIKTHAPEAVVIMVTNPVDVLTTYVQRKHQQNHAKVLGFGNILDSMRYQFYSNNADAKVIAEHGDAMLLVGDDGKFAEQVRSGAKSIVDFLQNRSTMFAPAAGLAKLIGAIATDSKEVLPVGAYLEGQFGVSNVSLGLPCKIGRGGVEEIVLPELSASEQANFAAAAEKIEVMLAGK